LTHSSSGAAPAAAIRFRRGDSRNAIAIEVLTTHMRVTVVGDPPGPDFLECFSEAYEAGALQYNMCTLVDLIRFNGRIDWTAIAAIAKLAPWGEDAKRRSAVAYLTESPWFGALLKLVSLLYPRTQHRQFADEGAALAWLGVMREAME
jgi:hypothetical protein